MTPLQKKTIEAIISIFETGSYTNKDRYSQVTRMRNDPGGLTYGKHQTTINGNGLYLLCVAYTEQPDAAFGAEFKPYLNQLMKRDSLLAIDEAFITLLRNAGRDTVMQKTQDVFFERNYWVPAYKKFENNGFELPISMAVIYDSFIHGSFKYIESLVKIPVTDEIEWTSAYVRARFNWLITHSNSLLRKTVYRSSTFSDLLGKQNYQLELPIGVQGALITETGLETGKQTKETDIKWNVPAHVPDNKSLLLFTNPPMKSERIRAFKKQLNIAGDFIIEPVTEDDVFDYTTDAAVRKMQAYFGLKADGIVGAETIRVLGL